MKQTGLIVKEPTPTDYFMGGVTGIQKKIINPSGNWKQWLPSKERQVARDYSFDTISCTTFSALNFIETLISFLIDQKEVSGDFISFLKSDGYMDDEGKLNFSDRFIAIKSGTTKHGNDFGTVWNAIRKFGLIPESMFPFGGSNFDEYHDKTKITKEMTDQGEKWIKYIEVMYEWVFFSADVSNQNMTNIEAQLVKEALTDSPVQYGTPKPASHAVMGYGMGAVDILTFDTYDPFDTADTKFKGVHFVIRGSIAEKSRLPRVLKVGMSGDDVKKLQSDLNFVMGSTLFVDGDFGAKTKKVVSDFQKKYGLFVDGIAGKVTITTLKNKVEEKKTLNLSKLGLRPLVERQAQLFIDKCSARGMPIRITSALRTFEKQTELYNQGRTTPGPIVTNAKAGYSFHNYGVAIDIYAINGSSYNEIAKIGKECGFEWGGDFKTFKDTPHFEIKLGYSISDFLNKRVDYRKYD